MRSPCDYPFTLSGYLDWLCSLAGLSARNDPEGYADIVARYGPPETRKFLSGPTQEGAPNSGCMVTQVGAVERFFGAHEKQCPLVAPVGLDRWSVMTHWAGENRALLAPGQWAPEPGDIVLLFVPPNHQHWVGLVSENADGAWRTIEGGGTPDAGYQHISEAEVRFEKHGAQWFERVHQKPVVQIVRVQTLIEAYQ